MRILWSVTSAARAEAGPSEVQASSASSPPMRQHAALAIVFVECPLLVGESPHMLSNMRLISLQYW